MYCPLPSRYMRRDLNCLRIFPCLLFLVFYSFFLALSFANHLPVNGVEKEKRERKGGSASAGSPVPLLLVYSSR